MKFKKIFFLAIMFTCLLTSYSHAYIGEDMESCIVPRVYVNPSHVHILPEGIFYVDAKGNLEIAGGIFCDKQGVYVLKYFYCPACGTWNYGDICLKNDCSLYMKE